MFGVLLAALAGATLVARAAHGRAERVVADPAPGPNGNGTGAPACQPATPYVVATQGPNSPGVLAPGLACSGPPMRLEDAPLYPIPDLPTAAPIPLPTSVRYVVEHRSALNDTRVLVRGLVVETLPYRPRAPGRGILDRPPSITLADGPATQRDERYDLVVDLPPGDDGAYASGQVVELPIRVSGGRIAVRGRKDG